MLRRLIPTGRSPTRPNLTPTPVARGRDSTAPATTSRRGVTRSGFSAWTRGRMEKWRIIRY